jgi:hypothetical protein
VDFTYFAFDRSRECLHRETNCLRRRQVRAAFFIAAAKFFCRYDNRNNSCRTKAWNAIRK